MKTIFLLTATTSTVQGAFKNTAPGRYKVALSLDSTNVAESVSLFEKTDGGDERVIAKGGAAAALTEADPALEWTSGGESISAKLADGSELATVTVTRIEDLR